MSGPRGWWFVPPAVAITAGRSVAGDGPGVAGGSSIDLHPSAGSGMHLEGRS